MTKRKKNSDITTLGITVKTKRKLMRLKEYGETFDELVERLIKDRNAQAGTMFFIIIAAVVAGIAYIVLGKIMDLFLDIHNTNTGFPVSYAQSQAVAHQVMIFNALPFIILILITFTVIKVAVSRRSGQV